MIIIDLEMTCCANDEFAPEDMEVIEIGAVRLDDALEIVGDFQCYVRPVINPTLTPFCLTLLPLTQADVDGAQEFSVAWESMLQWVGGDDLFASWGKSDLGWLKRDCERHDAPIWFTQHVDLHRAFGSSQRRLLKRFGVEWQGARHSAIADAMTYAKFVELGKPTFRVRGI